MEKKCARTVPQSKYEHNSPEITKWWLQLFNVIESDAAIPPETRLSLLKELIPIRIIHRVSKILTLEMEKFHLDGSVEKADTKFVRRSDDGRLSDDTGKSVVATDELGTSKSSLKLKLSSLVNDKVNAYVKFFKCRPDRAAIWRELPPLAWDEMNLNQIAEAITETIAKDFVQWLTTVGGNQETSVNVQSIIEMFEIGSQIHSATTLRVEVKHMPSVPQKVAEAKGVPELAKQQMLHREIKKDQKASKRKPKIVAFGRRLPTDAQFKPPEKNIYKKWLHCEKLPEKLETMAAVWQGITHLKSTRAFCEYIYSEHPEIKPPKYLVENGMMDPKKILSPIASLTSSNFGNVSRYSLYLQ